jgi:anthranilate synthase component 1
VARYPKALKDPALPDQERMRGPSVLDALRLLAGAIMDEPLGAAPAPGLFGALAYEAIDLFEDLPPRRPDPLADPDASFVLALDAIYYDHVRGNVRVVTRSAPSMGLEDDTGRHNTMVDALRGPVPEVIASDVPIVEEKAAESDVSEREFLDAVSRFLGHIRRGDIFQGVLSRCFSMRSSTPTLWVYEILRGLNPSPYMFHLDLGDGVLLGASPETSIKVEDGMIEIRPIAGTAPRGFRAGGSVDADLDSRLAMALLLDRKEQAEHAMLVDLARNDVARVSVPGTRRVIDPLTIEKYSHVQHLVSRVCGTLLPGLDALHAVRASMNMGTLTGAPKLRAMELIREAEPTSRGFYGGAAGYLLADGTFDSCIVIRSLRWKDGIYCTRAGAGIVQDSVPERELAEVQHKARACRLAVALAERGRP